MKRNLLYLLTLICSMNLFTACSSDDDKIEILPVEDLTGVYKGILSVSLGTEPVEAPQNITLTKSGENAIKMELKDFKFMVFEVGDIVIDNCAVTKEGDKYYFTGQQVLDLTDKGLGRCPVNIVKGEVNGDKVILELTVDTTVPVELTVKVGFDGTKLKGNESSEAKITSFTFDSEVVMEQPKINEETGKISFKVKESATAEELKLTPIITISEKATITPAKDEVQDFSNGKSVNYKVMAEDGTMKEYEVSIAGVQSSLKYTFEDWTDALGGKNPYYDPQPSNELATPNKGVSFLYTVGKYKGEYPTLKEENGVTGMGIKLVTRYTKTTSAIPPTITAGTVFTGEMTITLASLSEPLKATHFGIPYNKKPVYFKGHYKYTPGDTFRDGSNKGDVIVENITDECSIKAILYEIANEKDYLDGTNINDPSKRVAIAELKDGTAKSEFTSFNLPFEFSEGKEYNPESKYKLAIICTASKEGDLFKGAPDSTLILDDLEIIGE